MNRSSRTTLAKQTIEILKEGSYVLPNGRAVNIAPSVQRCLAGTRAFTPEDLYDIRDVVLSSRPTYPETTIEVCNETTLCGAARLQSEHHGQRIAVLNFASAKNPGGGFLKGSQAQEESLARSSALYASLLRAPEHYDFHRQTRTSLYSHRIIVSPDCPVFRDDDGRLLERPYAVTFITSPAPNRGAVARNSPSDLPLVREILRRRAELVLALGARYDCSCVVLGAWGCGVFRNEPKMVAQVKAGLLLHGQPWHGRFARVVFSVLDISRERLTYGAFVSEFGCATDRKVGE